MKRELSTIPIGSPVRVRMKDHTERYGHLSAVGDDAFQIESPELIIIDYSEVKSVRITDVVPKLGNSAFGKKGRKFLLAAGLVAVLLIITVVELRKS